MHEQLEDSNIYKRLVDIGLALSIEKDIDSLLEIILREAKTIVNADAGSIYLRTAEGTLRFVIVLNDSLSIFQGGSSENEVSLPDVPLADAEGNANLSNIASRCAVEGKTVTVDDSYTSTEFDFSGTRRFDEMTGYRSTSFLTVPLKNFEDQSIGVLQLLNAQNADGTVIPFPTIVHPVVEALASQASVAIENRRLMDEQDALKSHLEGEVESRTSQLREALTRLSKAHAKLKEMTTIDAVTGIKNRQHFDEIFGKEVRRASRQTHDLSLLLIDIDLFKDVNDTYGHLAGDDCLNEVAQSINRMLNRPSDVVARYGGEEFVVVLPYVAANNAIQLAEQLREHIERHTFKIDEHEIQITVSIGVASAGSDAQLDAKALIRQADEALYRAKAAGRNQVHGVLGYASEG
jgi:diguanylate cyclase (GGDEF)-like protein